MTDTESKPYSASSANETGGGPATVSASKQQAAALIKQAQVILTVLYLTTVGVGMMFYHQKYSQFDINIFQYADIFYFLVAPFEDAFILALCALALGLFLTIFWFDNTLEKRFPRAYRYWSMGTSESSLFQSMKPASWLLMLISLLYLYSDYYGNSAKEKVLESEPISVVFENGEVAVGRMIGKTDTTLFLIEEASIKAIPLGSAVKEIVLTSFTDPTSEPIQEPAGETP